MIVIARTRLKLKELGEPDVEIRFSGPELPIRIWGSSAYWLFALPPGFEGIQIHTDGYRFVIEIRDGRVWRVYEELTRLPRHLFPSDMRAAYEKAIRVIRNENLRL